MSAELHVLNDSTLLLRALLDLLHTFSHETKDRYISMAIALMARSVRVFLPQWQR